MRDRYPPHPRIKVLLEQFGIASPTALTPAEIELIQLAQDELMRLLPVRLFMANRWHAPAARLLVLGPGRAGLSGTELFACRGIIVEARKAMHEADARVGC